MWGTYEEAAEALLKKLGFQPEDITKGSLKELGKKIHDYKKMAAELNVGDMTLQDIVKELEKPARDPKAHFTDGCVGDEGFNSRNDFKGNCEKCD